MRAVAKLDTYGVDPHCVKVTTIHTYFMLVVNSLLHTGYNVFVFNFGVLLCTDFFVKKVEASHTRYRALGPELILVYRQSDRR